VTRRQARRLRRPAARLRGLTAGHAREEGIGAVDAEFCLSLLAVQLKASLAYLM